MAKWILTLLLTSFIGLAFSQSLEGNWYFQSIADTEGKSLREITYGDFMIVKNDSFEYHIQKGELHAKGTWTLNENELSFFYDLPADTVRFYDIITLTDNELIIQEGSTLFNFYQNKEKKQELIPAAPNNGEGNFNITDFLRGILGLVALIFITYLLSSKKKAISWRLVVNGILIQILFAFLILKVEVVRLAFDWMSAAFVTLLGFTQAGSSFLFAGLVTDTTSFGYIFAFQVLPTILFFSALTSLLFYFGILQKIVWLFAWIMKKTLRLSGAESLAAAGNIFLGQTEAPLLIKPYIEKMTRSEMLCLMAGGMATIAGGVLAAYIGFLGGSDPVQQIFFAKHLLAASVMSAPAAVVAAKMLLPETEEINKDMTISEEKIGRNALEAITNGTLQGLKLAVNVGAMLLVFIALIAMVNYFLGDFLGAQLGLNEKIAELTGGRYQSLSLQFILGYSLAPLTWLMGVHSQDIVLVGQLLGEKTILNEFVAYVSLGDMKNAGVFYEEKSIIIGTYILCGFANFASIGIQIGGIGALAPSRRGTLSELGIKALIAGTLASLYTAVIVGMLI
jgi:CNT family concentrative nucleoside transporter